MQVIRGAQTLSSLPTPAVVAIGNFDGVHRGHQEIIRELLAQSQGRTSVVYSFRPHPQIALRPEKSTELLLTYEEKLRELERLGVELVVEEPFSREFSSLSAPQFFSEHLVRRLGAQAIVVGYDFAFGKGREGHLDQMRALCAGARIPLTVVPPREWDGQVVSSSKIRAALKAGDLESAQAWLGSPFYYQSIVVHGDGRGRTIGVPTANFKMIAKSGEKLALPYGVYVTRCSVTGGFNAAPSITNVGVRPTFQKDSSNPDHPEPYFLVETHLLESGGDLYGRELKVEFLKKLRSEMRFGDAVLLRAQIAKDLAQAREYHRLAQKT